MLSDTFLIVITENIAFFILVNNYIQIYEENNKQFKTQKHDRLIYTIEKIDNSKIQKNDLPFLMEIHIMHMLGTNWEHQIDFRSDSLREGNVILEYNLERNPIPYVYVYIDD